MPNKKRPNDPNRFVWQPGDLQPAKDKKKAPASPKKQTPGKPK